MGSYRFLLSRRWALFAVTVAILAYGAWWLGEWQFGRLTDRQADNAVVRTNESLEPAPVDEVLSPTREVDEADEWRQVSATGFYDTENTVIVRYRSNDDGAPGVDVVVPLVTANGTTLVVDRGFLPTERSGTVDDADVPPAPSGEVTVTGWVRVDGTGSSTEVDDLSTRAISSERIGEAIGRPVYDGFVDVSSEQPEAPVSDVTLQRRDLPELDNGPHFFYGLQWWFFGVLALFGFGYLAYDERKRGPHSERPRRARPARRTNVPAAYRRGPAADDQGDQGDQGDEGDQGEARIRSTAGPGSSGPP